MFSNRFASGCSMTACNATCCQGGVTLDVAERDAILAHADLITGHMEPDQEHDSAGWFDNTVIQDPDFPSGLALLTPVTRAEVEDTCYSILTSLGFPTTAWQAGGVARTLVTLVSQKVSDQTTVMFAPVTSGGFLDYATGRWLTLLAYSVYGVDRIAAVQANGDVTFTNSTLGILGPYAIGELQFANNVTGATYTNSEVVTVGAGLSADFAIIADIAGTGGNAVATKIEWATPIPWPRGG